MQIVTPKQMSTIEESSEKIGVSRRQLMENAGKALAGLIDEYCRKNTSLPPEESSIVFLVGKGNNGGDGYAASNILVYRGYKITVISVSGQPESELAKEMYLRLPRERITFIDGYRSKNVEAAIEAAELNYNTTPDVLNISELEKKSNRNPIENILLKEKKRMLTVKNAIVGADVLIDCVYGTGFHGQLDKNTASIFAIGTSAYCISADVPSGGNCISGTVSNGIFKADETLVFGYIKTGMTQFPLKRYCGKITIADIGIPNEAIAAIKNERQYFRIERNHLAAFPPKRAIDAHKGAFGRVLVIGGSSSMRGAAAFASLGAFRSGAGLVSVASVEKCINTVSVLVPEATYIELEGDSSGFILYEPNRERLLEAMEKANAIVLGCGMGVTQDTIELTRFVSENAKCPLVIDADGINCISNDIDILVKKGSDVIITPHAAEMARIIGCETDFILENRIIAAEKYAEKYEITVVLKGAGTIVANNRCTAVNHTGNPGMSVGGSGDILAGMIGSIIAQGCDIFDSACAGVYMHGLAGDSAAEKIGMESMLPRDILDNLSDSFRILKKKQQVIK